MNSLSDCIGEEDNSRSFARNLETIQEVPIYAAYLSRRYHAFSPPRLNGSTNTENVTIGIGIETYVFSDSFLNLTFKADV